MSVSNISIVGVLAASAIFTASLLWNDAIQSLIMRWFPNEAISSMGDSISHTPSKPTYAAIWAKFGFALGLTIVLILLVMFAAGLIEKVPHLKRLSVIV